MWQGKAWLAVPLLLLVAGSSLRPLAAQPAPSGREVQIAPPGPDPMEEVALAANPRGDLFVVWRIGSQVFGRLHARDGRPLDEASAVGSGSGFIVVPAGSGFAVLGLRTAASAPLRTGQLYDAAALPIGDPFVLETPASTPVSLGPPPEAVVAPDGQLGVVWAGTDSQTGHTAIFLRHFTAAGVPLGAPRPVAGLNGGEPRYLDLARSLDGRYLVTWLEAGSYRVSARVLGPDGTALTPPIRLSNGKSFDQPAGAFTADGGLFFVWHGEHPPYSQSPATSRRGILMRRYDAAGRPVGGVHLLENEATGPSVAGPLLVGGPGQPLFLVWWGGAAGLQVREVADDGTVGPAVANRLFRASGRPFAAAAWGEGGIAVASRRFSLDHGRDRGLWLQGFATASAGQLRLDRSRTAALEGGPVALRVERRDGIRGAVTVDYTVRREGAPAGEVLAAGTVVFPDGASNPQEVPVPVADDSLAAVRDSLVVTLSQPTGGAELGLPFQATVMVQDDDTPSPLFQNAGPFFEVGTAFSSSREAAGNPRVAALTHGGFAVFWPVTTHPLPLPHIASRLYGPADDTLSLNLLPGHAADAIWITAQPDGGLTVVGRYHGELFERLGVFGQHLDASGRPRTGTFPLPDAIIAVAAGPAGGLVVLLQDYRDGRLALLRVGPHGDVLGPPAAVQPGSTCATVRPVLATDATGRAVVGWQDPTCTRILLRRFTPEGKPLGAAVEVDPRSGLPPDRFPGAMALAVAPDGRVVLAWEAEGDGDGRGIFLQRFTATGRPRPRAWEILPVNSRWPGDQTAPSVAVQEDGRFLVAWVSPGERGGKIFGQSFDDDGRALGSDFALDSRFPAAETAVALSTTPAGGYVAAWNGWDREGIFARRLTAPQP